MNNLQATQIKALTALKAGIQGAVILPGDASFDTARQVWNAMIDKHPAAIVRCAATPDVVQAVNFAREQGLRLAVRGGGHNIAGSAVCDDGIVIDLSPMKAVQVDAGKRRASVEGGATLADFDAAAQVHGLAVPLGINSTTGVAGLTLGAGFGWLSRKYGMTIDSLESAEVVTAAGEVLQRQRHRAPRPVLGAARRQRQFRRRDALRFPAPSGRPECARRPDRLSVCRGQVGAAAVPRIHGPARPTSFPSGPSCARRRRCLSCPKRSMARRWSYWRCSTRAIQSKARR